MTKPRNVVASVLARLRNVAADSGLSFNDILQAYVIERFLARLGQSPHADTVLLKDALMLRVWGVPRARATMDIDLLRRGIADQAVLVRFVEQCAAIEDPSDGVIFEPSTISVESIRDATEYGGTRIRLQARLANVRPRMKDFYDVWILSRTVAFSGRDLSQAIRSTFERRRTSIPAELPAALTGAFYCDPIHVRQWGAFARRIGEAAPIDDFSRVAGDLVQFLMPVSAAAAATWVGHPVRWEPPGPWQ